MLDRHLAIACLLVILTGAGISTCQTARAQHPGHAEGHDWYRQLLTPHGYSCCNGTVDGREGDCRPVKARPTPISIACR